MHALQLRLAAHRDRQPQPRRVQQLLEHREVRVHDVVLRDEAHLVAERLRLEVDLRAVEVDPSGDLRVVGAPSERGDERGLARSGRPHDRGELGGGDDAGQAVEDRLDALRVGVVKLHRQIEEADLRQSLLLVALEPIVGVLADVRRPLPPPRKLLRELPLRRLRLAAAAAARRERERRRRRADTTRPRRAARGGGVGDGEGLRVGANARRVAHEVDGLVEQFARPFLLCVLLEPPLDPAHALLAPVEAEVQDRGDDDHEEGGGEDPNQQVILVPLGPAGSTTERRSTSSAASTHPAEAALWAQDRFEGVGQYVPAGHGFSIPEPAGQ